MRGPLPPHPAGKRARPGNRKSRGIRRGSPSGRAGRTGHGVAAVDRLDALHVAVKAVRRGGTVSVSGVYGGEIDPMPMMEMFDRGVQLRMGQAHVKRWIDDLMPMVTDTSDPLGVTSFATHHLPLEQAPHGYDIFRDKAEGCLKVVLQP